MENGLGISVLLVALGGAALAGDAPGAAPEPAAAKPVARDVTRATAPIHPASGSTTRGTAIFIREGESVTLQISLEGAPPGDHAVHLHETGDCSAPDATSAGAHWNPGGHNHGRWGTAPFHLGDIGNITVDQDGRGSLLLTTEAWSVGSGAENDVLGRAVIVHAAADDFTTQPTGAAGGRIGCGVIKE